MDPNHMHRGSSGDPSSHQDETLRREELARWLIDRLKSHPKLGEATITPETAFADLGLDSLEMVSITGDLEEAFGQRLSPRLLSEYPTISALAEHLAGLSNDHRRLEAVSPSGGRSAPKHVTFDQHPGYLELQEQFSLLETLQLFNPYFVTVEGVNGARSIIEGQPFSNYSSYNYVGLSGAPEVNRAAIEAVEQMGTSASASRLASGERSVHRELEREIAGFLGVPEAIVYIGGHTTNMSTIACLVGPGDVIFHDALAHDSILQGCLLSGARQIPFPHNDWQALDQLMKERRDRYRHALIVVEGVYSMDGDIPDLPRFIEVKNRHGAWLMVDEAHSLGVIGRTGRGISEYHGVDPSTVDVWMGTLSKSLASCGGYIAGSPALVKLLKYRSRGFVYSAGMPPPNAAAALAALRILQAEPERVQRLQARVAYFLQAARARGLDTGLSSGGAVVPIMVGSTALGLRLTDAIARRGVLAHPMVYPAVAEDGARLRFFITSEHTEEQIDETLDIVATELIALKRELISAHDPAEGGGAWT